MRNFILTVGDPDEPFPVNIRVDESLLKQCLEVLPSLHENLTQGDVGVCYNLQEAIRQKNGGNAENVYDIVSSFARGWEHHLGDWSYFVPRTPEEIYSDSAKWKGRGLEYRLDLIQYLIKGITELLDTPDEE